MIPNVSAVLPDIVAAAVTPVVMISASATLILGVNSKHQSMSDRLRSITNELRCTEVPTQRREVLLEQVVLFERRIKYSSIAHRLLYVAIVTFLGMMLSILAPNTMQWTPFAYLLFLVGVVLMLAAVTFEFAELWYSNRTLELEISDVPLPKGSREMPEKSAQPRRAQ